MLSISDVERGVMGIRTPKQKSRLFQQRQRTWSQNKSSDISSACGKARFRTELDAKIALASVQRQRRGRVRDKDEKRYYLCPQCHGYHLTSKPRYSGKSRYSEKDKPVARVNTVPAKLKGVSVFIEHIGEDWIYTIPEFDAYGKAASQEEAKQTVRTIMNFVDDSITASFRYYSDDQNIELFYAQQVAGSQNSCTTEKPSYMEPLLRQLRSILFRNGFRFRKYDSRYPGPPDIVLPKYRTMVFVDSCLWHDRQECCRKALPPESQRIWQETHIDEWRRMVEERQRLIDEGWTVLSYWECRFCDNRKRAKRLNSFLNDVRSVANDLGKSS
nr:hypothetical protein [Bifidobacterium imperatoris]